MKKLLLALLISLPVAAADLHSGYTDMSPETQAMQDDDDGNPGMLWVIQGRDLWGRPPADKIPSCAACHGPITNMKCVAARYPVYDETSQGAVTLMGRINHCRTEFQHQSALGDDQDATLGLTAAVGNESRGLPISVATDGPLAKIGAQGRQIFTMRQGQLDLSCADCHNDLAGHSLGGSKIPQGHPNGYPLYRLEWQRIGSLERRLRNCLSGMRAAAYPDNSPDLLALEVYLTQRSIGLKVETPAVRP